MDLADFAPCILPLIILGIFGLVNVIRHMFFKKEKQAFTYDKRDNNGNINFGSYSGGDFSGDSGGDSSGDSGAGGGE